LTEAGFDVEVENDEVAGMNAALKKKPDLIIFDISLPETDDFDFIKLAKSSIKIAKIPIVVLTDLSAPADIKAGMGCRRQRIFRP